MLNTIIRAHTNLYFKNLVDNNREIYSEIRVCYFIKHAIFY